MDLHCFERYLFSFLRLRQAHGVISWLAHPGEPSAPAGRTWWMAWWTRRTILIEAQDTRLQIPSLLLG